MEITNATSADSEEINKLYFDTWVSTYHNSEYQVTKEDIEDWLKGVLSPETIENHKKWLDNLPDDLKVWVAKEDGKVIGFCYVKKGNEAEHNKLRAIYVLPSYQGNGVGSALWEKAQEFLNQKIETDVEVIAYNISTIEFYKKLGFIDTGKRVLDNQGFKLKSGVILPLAHLELPVKI